MRAGLLNETIKLYAKKKIRDEYGYETTELVIKGQYRARITHKSGNRSNENGEITFTNFDTITVRHYVKVDPTDVIEWDGRKYRITYISRDRLKQATNIEVELINE